MPQRSALTLTLALLLMPAFASAQADEFTAEYFNGLRQRQLFGLAEGYCLQRLGDPNLKAELRAEFTLELSRTFAEHARFTGGEEQDELWGRAAGVLDEFLQSQPRHPQRPQIEVQRALVPAARGEHLRGQTELFPGDQQLAEQAQQVVTEAIRRLGAADKMLGTQAARASRASPDSAAPSPLELRMLQTNVRLRLGAALLDQAKLFPPGSPDRASSLIDAEEQLRPIAGGLTGEDLTWTAQLLLAELSRLRGDTKQAAALLAAIERENPPQTVIDRIVAQRVEILLDLQKPADAGELLSRYRRTRVNLPGELQFLRVRTSAALWQIAVDRKDENLAAQLMTELEGQAAAAEREAGGYWGRRGRLLLDDLKQTGQYGSELAGAIRTARSAFQSGRHDDAIREYGTAATLARRAGRDDVAMDLGFTRASIALNAGRLDQAVDDFSALAEQFPKHAKAADAHLLWAYALGKLYENERTADRRETYTAALEEHRSRFAVGPTAAEATWMLAVLQELRLQATAALALYQEIPADHRRGPAAQVAAARCYETILERARAVDAVAAEWEQRAVDDLARIVAAFPEEPAPLSAEQAEVAMRLARIRLHLNSPDYAEADRLLARVLAAWEQIRTPPNSAAENDSAAAADSAWPPLARTATQLRIASLAGQQQWRQAATLVQQLSDARPAEVLSVLDGLAAATARTDEATRRGVGELVLTAAVDLQSRRSDLSAEDQQRLDRSLAEAYASTDQPRRAVEVYERLLAEAPKDRTLLTSLAELLIACGDRDCLAKAKEHWRTLESLEKPGTAAWLNARYHVVWCGLALGQHEETRKLLGVTRLLYPDLGGDSLQSKFEELERKVKSQK